MLDDGTVFVEQRSALVPEDINGVMDVYSWHAGTPELVSAGQDPSPSWFGTASTDGRSVLFLTNQSLVGADTDKNIDMYDARIEGGSPPSGRPEPHRHARGRVQVGPAGRADAPARRQLRHGGGVLLKSRAIRERQVAQAKRLSARLSEGFGSSSAEQGKRAKALGVRPRSCGTVPASSSRPPARQNQADSCGVTR